MVQIIMDVFIVAIGFAGVQIAYNSIVYAQYTSKNWLKFGIAFVIITAVTIAMLIGASLLTNVPVLGGVISGINLIAHLFWTYIYPVRWLIATWFVAIPLLAMIVLTTQAGLRYRNKKATFEADLAKKEQARKDSKVIKPSEPEAEPEPTDDVVTVETEDEDVISLETPISQPVKLDLLDDYVLDMNGVSPSQIDVSTVDAIRTSRDLAKTQGLLVDNRRTGRYVLMYASQDGLNQARAWMKHNHFNSNDLPKSPTVATIVDGDVSFKAIKELLQEVG